MHSIMFLHRDFNAKVCKGDILKPTNGNANLTKQGKHFEANNWE
jgi:hypothetical protein